MQGAVSLTIKVNPVAHRQLAADARERGYGATAYAQMLFDAAFAARIGQERGEEPVDAELDRQVMLVFRLAGQTDTASVARATGIPEPRVVRILDGWKAAGEGRRGATPAKPTDWTETVRDMWAAGASCAAIGEAVRLSPAHVSAWAKRHRDICPARPVGRRKAV